jgi:hypothetical protein
MVEFFVFQEVPGSNLGLQTGYSEGVRRFSQSLQAYSGIHIKLVQDGFLPRPSQFIIHVSSSHSTLYSFELLRKRR